MNAIIDELTFRSYAYNRQRSPDITPERWGKIFSDWQSLEAKYQAWLASR